MSRTYTTGELAAHFDVDRWQIQRLFEDRLIVPSAHAGHFRLIETKDLGKVERALRARGYLPEKAKKETAAAK